MTDQPIYPHTMREPGSMAHRLCCNSCGKSVSSAFQPFPTETPDKGLVVRAWIECPECMEKKSKEITNAFGEPF
jgi:hypothetical protein